MFSSIAVRPELAKAARFSLLRFLSATPGKYRAQVGVLVCVHIHTCMHACMHTYIAAYLGDDACGAHIEVGAELNSSMHVYIHTT